MSLSNPSGDKTASLFMNKMKIYLKFTQNLILNLIVVKFYLNNPVQTFLNFHLHFQDKMGNFFNINL